MTIIVSVLSVLHKHHTSVPGRHYSLKACCFIFTYLVVESDCKLFAICARLLSMSFKFSSVIETAIMTATTPAVPPPVPEEEEYYSSWSLFLVCILLVLSLLTSYYLQIKRIRAVHETLVSIVAGMFVGLVVRLAPGTMIRDMLVSLGACC